MPQESASISDDAESIEDDTTWKEGARNILGRKIDNYKVITKTNYYTSVDDFYSKLAERYDKSSDNQPIDDFALAELNRQCLELAENALEKVDWNKYR